MKGEQEIFNDSESVFLQKLNYSNYVKTINKQLTKLLPKRDAIRSHSFIFALQH